MTWTHFWDMHSGGDNKLPPYNHIYIEKPEDEAIEYFETRFHRDPRNVTLTCCGEDFSISTAISLSEITGYHRKREWNKNTKIWEDGPETIPVEQYITEEDVLVVFEEEMVMPFADVMEAAFVAINRGTDIAMLELSYSKGVLRLTTGIRFNKFTCDGMLQSHRTFEIDEYISKEELTESIYRKCVKTLLDMRDNLSIVKHSE